ncbi:MAG: sensor histidine kinase [Verrucomicrobiota bacterium]
MKLGLPLYARFLGWFGLNLVLLGGVFWVLVRSELRVDTLLAGLAGDRVQPVAEVVFGELRSRPREEWDGVLGRFGAVYGVQFLLLNERGERMAGAAVEVPEEVRQRGRGPRGGPGRREGPWRPGEGAGPPRPGEGGEPPRGMDGPGPEPGLGRRPEGGRPEIGGARLLLRAGVPAAYWMLVRGPLGGFEAGRPPVARLVIRSPTFSAGGLFFDFTPWWMGGAAVIALSALWWLPFVRSMTVAIRQMTEATERVAEGRFDAVVETRRSDELGRLGGAINRMTGRLGGFVTGQKRFLGDIAHELCSPLARMEMALGVLEQRADARQAEYVEDVREEVRHMSGLVNELLSFSKAGLRGRDLPLARVEVAWLVDRVAAREGLAADGLRLDVPAGLAVEAEPELLARALGNLLRNAQRYAGPAGPIEVSARPQGDRVQLIVADHGPGVAPAELARLGEPFYRPDAARTREEGGAGLGLAIVRSCVEACRGSVALANRQPTGFQATLTLVRAPAP